MEISSVAGIARAGAARHPERAALHFGNETTTYGELDRCAKARMAVVGVITRLAPPQIKYVLADAEARVP